MSDETPHNRDPYAIGPNMPFAKPGQRHCDMPKCPFAADKRVTLKVLGHVYTFCTVEHRALAWEWTRGLSRD